MHRFTPWAIALLTSAAIAASASARAADSAEACRANCHSNLTACSKNDSARLGLIIPIDAEERYRFCVQMIRSCLAECPRSTRKE